MTNTGRYKRRNYFINKEFQGKIMFNYFILFALGSILFVGIFSFFSSNTLSIVYDNYHLQLGTTPEILFDKLLSSQWLFIVIGGLVVTFITMRLTHRIAGPFYRFEKSLDEMIGRDISGKIILRQKDEGVELAKKINEFNSVLSKNLAYFHNKTSEIAISVEMLETALDQPDKDITDISRLIGIIKEGQKEIEAAVNDYTFNSKLRP